MSEQTDDGHYLYEFVEEICITWGRGLNAFEQVAFRHTGGVVYES